MATPEDEEVAVESITPRWEWRAFSRDFGPAGESLAAVGAQGSKDSDEVYVLANERGIVKVRDALMDLKVLEAVDEHGLQRWMPIMKAAFPLSRADAQRVCEVLGVASPSLGADEYTLDALLEEARASGIPATVVPVHKHRVRYALPGCAAELSDVSAEGRSTRTLAVESEDPAAVIAALRSLGLGGYRNTSYARGLAELIGSRVARFAVIDVGTNSVKFHAAERSGDGAWVTLADRAEVTRLGEDLQRRGSIAAEALQRTTAAVAGMAEEARQLDVGAIAAVGTAALRQAADAQDVIRAIEADSGVRIEVITGDEESRLAYLAVERALGPSAGSLVVFDTGGGSSQFTFGRDGHVDERFSLDVGAVRVTERFGLDRVASREAVDAAMAALADDLSRIAGRPRPDVLVGMGGAMTNLTAVSLAMADYDPARVQGSQLTSEEVLRQIEQYRHLEADARRSIVGLQPKRAEVILAGACIVLAVMRLLGHDRLVVSDRGLRHGVLAERFGA